MSPTTESEVFAEAVASMHALIDKCAVGTVLHTFMVSTLWEIEDMRGPALALVQG
jgi:hypothetical protein